MKENRFIVPVFMLLLGGLGLSLWNQFELRDALDDWKETGEDAGAGGDFPAAAGVTGEAGADAAYAAAEIGELRRELARVTGKMEEISETIAAFEARATSGNVISLGDGRVIGASEFYGAEAAAQAYVAKGRAWGPEQVVGEPDTPGAGDIASAWAPKQQDGGEEWLQLDYDQPVDLSEINVHETHNAGAISKIVATLENGSEVVVWEGTMEAEPAPIERVFQVDGSVRARSVTVHMDTTRVPGWNEIDAVEIVGRDQSRQWASGAKASSTYAE